MGHSILQTILLVLYGGQYDLLLLPGILLFTPPWLSSTLSASASQWELMFSLLTNETGQKNLKCNCFSIEDFKTPFPAFCHAPTHAHIEKTQQIKCIYFASRLAAVIPLGYNSLLSASSPRWMRIPSQAESWGEEIKAVIGTRTERNRAFSPARHQSRVSPATRVSRCREE